MFDGCGSWLIVVVGVVCAVVFFVVVFVGVDKYDLCVVCWCWC